MKPKILEVFTLMNDDLFEQYFEFGYTYILLPHFLQNKSKILVSRVLLSRISSTQRTFFDGATALVQDSLVVQSMNIYTSINV